VSRVDAVRSPAKVLWISCVAEKGGAEVYLLNFLRNLDRSRFLPSVVLLRAGPFETDLRQLGVEVFVLARHRMRHAWAVGRAILRIRALIGEHHFDLVHSNGFRAHSYGGIAARIARVPAVWSVHTVEAPGLATRVIPGIPVCSVSANAPRTADWFAARGLPVNLIWPPVDLVQLKERAGRAELCARFAIPSAARWVAMAARLQRYKGHEFLLRALAALPADMENVHVMFIGGTLFGNEPDYPSQLRQLARQLGIEQRVHFTGFVSDRELHGLVAGSEVMVHPALEEDFGLVVAEGQALGTPVIAFSAPGPSAIIEHGRTGELVPVGDQSRLNTALVRMLQASPEHRQHLGRAGRERVERLFDARLATRRLEGIYDACMGGDPLELDGERQPQLLSGRSCLRS
jgi:glycosyltransferase involved in cell wall biosynthesis